MLVETIRFHDPVAGAIVGGGTVSAVGVGLATAGIATAGDGSTWAVAKLVTGGPAG